MIEIALSDLVGNPNEYAASVIDKNEKITLVINGRKLILMSVYDFSMMQTILDIASTVFDEEYAEKRRH